MPCQPIKQETDDGDRWGQFALDEAPAFEGG
jgi:hypothetical protein